MATVSFDSTFELQPQYVEPFFTALEHSAGTNREVKSPYVSEENRKRGEELLKQFYSN